MKRTTSTLAALVVAAAAAVLLPAIAAADGPARPDDRATRGVGAVTLARTTTPVRPDDRATRGVEAVTLARTTTPVRPDDRATRGAVRPDVQTQAFAAVARTPSGAPSSWVTSADANLAALSISAGFDWADAGIGAIGGAGLVLLLVGGAMPLAARRTAARVALR